MAVLCQILVGTRDIVGLYFYNLRERYFCKIFFSNDTFCTVMMLNDELKTNHSEALSSQTLDHSSEELQLSRQNVRKGP